MATLDGGGTKEWYDDQLPKVPENAREVLEKYSGVEPSYVQQHVYDLREKAWSVFEYPCIGQYYFLNFGIADSMYYQEILQRLDQDEKLMDLGCCFGQDIRKLVFDGAPSQNLAGCDLEESFIQFGYDLFKDQDTLRSQFYTSDLSQPSREIEKLHETFDMLHAASFFHLFTWETQLRLLTACLKLLRNRPGSMLVGKQVALDEPTTWQHKSSPEGQMYVHNGDSLKRMWKEVDEITGKHWLLETHLVANPYWAQKAKGPPLRQLYYSARLQ